MKQWIRRYLGLDDLQTSVETSSSRTQDMLIINSIETKRLINRVEPVMIGIERIISKLDPMFAQSENPLDNPNRKAESDRLGKEAIDRLLAENAARHHSHGDE